MTCDQVNPTNRRAADTMASALSPCPVGSFPLVNFGIVDRLTGAWMNYPIKRLVAPGTHVAWG
jgi:hypothetical protein